MTFRQFDMDTTEYRDALLLRAEVLRIPLGLTFTDAELARETKCFHLGGFDDQRLVAVLLLQPVDKHTVQMRQVAVRPELQRTGVGSQLIEFAEDFARQKGHRTLLAHARSTALAFYQRLGYSPSGDEFIEQTIPHQLVMKAL